MRAAAAGLLFCLVFATLCLRASADDEGKAAARRLLDSGDEQLARGDELLAKGKKVEAQEAFLAALADYEGAYAAFPDAKIFFAIGLAEKSLGRYVDALGHFDQFLAEVGGADGLRAKVEVHTSEIKSFLGFIFFRIEPSGAKIEIDGVDVGKAPLNRPHYVPPGEHEYRISKPGFRSASGTITVEPGDAREDEITLERNPDATADETPDEEEPVAVVRGPEPTRRPLLVGLALTGSFALAGTVTGFLALSKHNTFTNEMSSASTRESARKSGKNLALATDVFVIGAIAAGTYTAYYYFTQYRGRVGAESSVTVAPWAGESSGGVSMAGSF